MNNLTTLCIFGLALAFVLTIAAFSIRAGVRWFFGNEESPRL